MTIRLVIVTPAVHRRGGGTEKCVSWLIEDLAPRCELTVYTGEMADTDVSACRVHLLPMLTRPRLLKYLTFLAANTMTLALHRRRFDVVLATGGDCLFADVTWAHFCTSAWLDVLRQGDVAMPTATLAQRLRALHYRTFLWVASRIERHLYRRRKARSVIAVSEGTRAELIRQYGAHPGQVTVVPNAADDRVRLPLPVRQRRRREIRAWHRIPDQAGVLLFVAAGDWKRKGLLLVLQAMALLDDPKTHLLVVGHDDLALYKSEAQRLGIGPRAHFAGSTRSIEGYYAAADIFVYPSRYEAFSLVTLEAAAAGLPLVMTRINGAAELLRQGENGFLVRPDAHDIADRLRLLLGDASLLEYMGAAARASARRFTRAAVMEQVLRVCTTLPPVPEKEVAAA
jgi:UDP-glucose:(heptosyl)LPS alpha-1,3-glucosyltransferase